MIIFYCHKCGEKHAFKKKADMRCNCGHYITERERASDHVNMRTTWSSQTKVEFSNTTMDKDIADRNSK